MWKIGRNATLRGYTCHSSATVLMQSFRRGLEVLMGGATTQVLCIDFEVVLDLQRLAEEQWQRLRTRGSASVMAELQETACWATFAVGYTVTCCRPGELEWADNKDLIEWAQKPPVEVDGVPTSYIEANITESKTDQVAKGFKLYLATVTASGLRPKKWFSRLARANAAVGMRPTDPAFSKPAGGQWVGADMMTQHLRPMMKKIAAMEQPMASTSYLQSVDWTRIQVRSFRRSGIHRLRTKGVKREIVNYFGRWKADNKDAMLVR